MENCHSGVTPWAKMPAIANCTVMVMQFHQLRFILARFVFATLEAKEAKETPIKLLIDSFQNAISMGFYFSSVQRSSLCDGVSFSAHSLHAGMPSI